MLLVGGSDFVSGSALYPNSLFFFAGPLKPPIRLYCNFQVS